jgi:hypothetical protein
MEREREGLNKKIKKTRIEFSDIVERLKKENDMLKGMSLNKSRSNEAIKVIGEYVNL